MGDPIDNQCGLIPRIRKHFNQGSFSDVQVHVRGDTGLHKFYVHKMLLAMASETFSSMFYGQSDAPQTVQILHFTPQVVEKALLYLYSDEFSVTNINETTDVLRLAMEYKITDLMHVCLNHMEIDKLNVHNLFKVYEIALKENERTLVSYCQKMITRDTKAILASEQFPDIPLPLLQNFLKQNFLNISSEIEILKAVLRWCRNDCRRKRQPYEGICLRESINPLLPYLRFLTLSAEEFCDFVEENDIFTSHESSVITRKILQPGSSIRVPSGFCPNSKPRFSDTGSNHDTKPVSVRSNFETKSDEQNLLWNSVERQSPPLNSGNKIQNVSRSFQDHSYQASSFEQIESEERSRFVSFEKHVDTAVPKSQNNTTREHFNLKNFSNDETVQAPSSKPVFQFGSVKRTPMLTVKPVLKTTHRTFDFPLQDMQKAIGAVCNRDLRCSAKIQMIRGTIIIYGIELKVMSIPNYSEETVEVILALSGSNFPPKEIEHTGKLNNNILPIMFEESLKLTQNNYTEIEVSIDNLKLNRCHICQAENVELNCGLNTVAEISLKSNHSNEMEHMFFIISRLIYFPY